MLPNWGPCYKDTKYNSKGTKYNCKGTKYNIKTLQAYFTY